MHVTRSMACIQGFLLVYLSNHAAIAINWASDAATPRAQDARTPAPTFPMPMPDPAHKHMGAPRHKGTNTWTRAPLPTPGRGPIRKELLRQEGTDTWTSAQRALKPRPDQKFNVTSAAGPNASSQGAFSGPLENYKVSFEVGSLNDGSKGIFVIQVVPKWAPLAADRFKQLVNEQFFDDSNFFRVVPSFIAQFGIAADPMVSAQWNSKTIADDVPVVRVKNNRGRLSFAAASPATRSTQIYINIADNLYLDDQGFTPFAEVVSGMSVIDKLFSGYGDVAPFGPGPAQSQIEINGNAYLNQSFPKLSYIKRARIAMPRSSSFTSPLILVFLLGVTTAIIGVVFLLHAGFFEKYRSKLKWGMAFDAAVREP